MHWLNRWLPLLAERTAGGPLLEIGCGPGDDTVVLVEGGLDVIAFDVSPSAVAEASRRAPRARIHCQDARTAFPLLEQPIGAVVASLSLHYFPWDQTLALADRIRAVLRPGGVLLCRVNSVEDHAHGASGYPEIEQSYYLVEGQPKRFFDERSIAALFDSGWRRLSLEHYVTRKYRAPKAVWEIVVEKEEP